MKLYEDALSLIINYIDNSALRFTDNDILLNVVLGVGNAYQLKVNLWPKAVVLKQSSRCQWLWLIKILLDELFNLLMDLSLPRIKVLYFIFLINTFIVFLGLGENALIVIILTTARCRCYAMKFCRYDFTLNKLKFTSHWHRCQAHFVDYFIKRIASLSIITMLIWRLLLMFIQRWKSTLTQLVVLNGLFICPVLLVLRRQWWKT